jgi:SAM-dependent MidA family methyltransferase
LTLSFRVGKTELFDAMPILATLSDESEQVEVAVTVQAQAKGSYERTWVRNAIRERLEEAGIEAEVTLGDATSGT